MKIQDHYDAIVIGAGPAGLTAGIYLSRAKVKTLILNEGVIGGQMILTHQIANYPGVENINGYQLASIMKKQALDFGAHIKANIKIKEVNLEADQKSVVLSDGSVITSDSIILTPGGRPRTLGVTGEDLFKGKGISYCATCDGDFFTGKQIMVVGGGNSALEEAVSLTKYATRVTIVHQFDHFQAFEHAIEEAQNHPSIDIILNSTITSFDGSDSIEKVNIKNLKTGITTEHSTEGVFIFIGYKPNTEFIRDKIALNNAGEILVAHDMSTNIEGVYAAGDSIQKKYRQITTAVGEGTIAAMAAAEFVNKKKTAIKELV